MRCSFDFFFLVFLISSFQRCTHICCGLYVKVLLSANYASENVLILDVRDTTIAFAAVAATKIQRFNICRCRAALNVRNRRFLNLVIYVPTILYTNACLCVCVCVCLSHRQFTFVRATHLHLYTLLTYIYMHIYKYYHGVCISMQSHLVASIRDYTPFGFVPAYTPGS